MRQFERSLMLQTLDSALARPPRQPRSPAPGHPSARLRAEESEAGIQARIVRALLRHARPDQAGRRQDRADGAGAHAGGRRRRSRKRRRCPTSSTSTPNTTKRSRVRRRRRRDAVRQPRRRRRRSCAAGEKVGRNDPCPCGSGKKYKQCHGRLA